MDQGVMIGMLHHVCMIRRSNCGYQREGGHLLWVDVKLNQDEIAVGMYDILILRIGFHLMLNGIVELKGGAANLNFLEKEMS